MGSDRINGDFKNKDILSLDQFSKEDILKVLNIALRFKSSENFKPILLGVQGALLFYEPSSRTFGSFSCAFKRLGGQTIDIVSIQNSSVSKGETLEDTVKVFEQYSDIIVMRHPKKGSLQIAADSASIPVINAGDGVGEHPTQALLDLFTIYEKFESLDNLTGVLAGDMLNGRTVHSLIKGLSKFQNITLYLLSPKELKLSKEDFSEFSKLGIKLIEITEEKELPKNADFWYWTRVQKERFTNQDDYEKVKNKFILNNELLNNYAGKNTILLHPLPRVGEILEEVDEDPRALYLKTQVKNGVFTRMALLSLVLGKEK